MCGQVSKLVFYAQSTGAVISGPCVDNEINNNNIIKNQKNHIYALCAEEKRGKVSVCGQ